MLQLTKNNEIYVKSMLIHVPCCCEEQHQTSDILEILTLQYLFYYIFKVPEWLQLLHELLKKCITLKKTKSYIMNVTRSKLHLKGRRTTVRYIAVVYIC